MVKDYPCAHHEEHEGHEGDWEVGLWFGLRALRALRGESAARKGPRMSQPAEASIDLMNSQSPNSHYASKIFLCVTLRALRAPRSIPP